jgi:hypothetical protein
VLGVERERVAERCLGLHELARADARLPEQHERPRHLVPELERPPQVGDPLLVPAQLNEQAAEVVVRARMPRVEGHRRGVGRHRILEPPEPREDEPPPRVRIGHASIACERLVEHHQRLGIALALVEQVPEVARRPCAA